MLEETGKIDSASLPESDEHVPGNGSPVQEADGQGLLIDELARMPEKAILDEARLASIFRVNERTVRRWVGRNLLPPPIRLGNRPVWFAGRIVAHFEAAAERAERDAERRERAIRQFSP